MGPRLTISIHLTASTWAASPLFLSARLLESGVERLTNGVLHVAVRTLMQGCTGRMIEWWFAWGIDSEKYRWWHPGDHVYSAWENRTPGTVVGATHVAKERLGAGPVVDLQLMFLNPEEVLGAGALKDARARRDVSVALYG